jgi:hypothetical protein
MRLLRRLRAPIIVFGYVLTLVLLVLDVRREWSAYELVFLLLVLGALAALPAALVDSPRYRPTALVTHAIGAGIVALALHDTADKRALWVYAGAAFVSVALPASPPAYRRVSLLGVCLALILTIGAAAPALAWAGRQPNAMVCLLPGESVDALVGETYRFDPRAVVAGIGFDPPESSCVKLFFDAGATADDVEDVVRRYVADPRVTSVSRTR